MRSSGLPWEFEYLMNRELFGMEYVFTEMDELRSVWPECGGVIVVRKQARSPGMIGFSDRVACG